MQQTKKQTLFFGFFLALILLGALPHTVHAVEDCQKLGGDTTVVPVTVLDDKGKQHVVDNSGQNFFDGTMPSIDKKPVYLAPDGMAACAQKVGDTVYLKGWFWNDNLGWISFYCPGDGGTNRSIPCGLVHYGVTIDNFGNFSGYAWSSVGWIRFTCKASVGYNDTSVCAQSLFKVKMEFAAPANNRTWFPYTYAWSDTIGWFQFDSIKVPWFTLPDTIKPDCKNNIDKCLREKDLTPDEKFLIDENENEIKKDGPGPGGGLDLKAIKLTPGEIINPGDDFPVTWNKIKYYGNKAGDSANGKALNPVTQADVRNLLFRNVMKWKKVASTSCGDNGGYLMKFTADDQVFYCKGDVHLNAAANNWKGNKTVIVEDGNVYIENSLYSTSGQFGIIALKKNLDSEKNGNVFVYPQVLEMRVQIYADGLVLPANSQGAIATTPDYAISAADPNTSTLFGQLYIRGMIIAGNTASYKIGDKSINPGDLSALRSVPASPFDSTPIKWNDYFTGVKNDPIKGDNNGKYIATAPEKDTESVNGVVSVKKDPTTGEILYKKDNNGKIVKKQQTISLKTKLAPEKVLILQKQKIPDANKTPEDTKLFTEGVILQFEPPSSTLGGFEGTLGNTYKQTR